MQIEPRETAERKLNGVPDSFLVNVNGGTLYGGQAKEFSTGQLRHMREALEEALLKVRSQDAREKIEDVIDRIGC
jgi:hypothetical protein